MRFSLDDGKRLCRCTFLGFKGDSDERGGLEGRVRDAFDLSGFGRNREKISPGLEVVVSDEWCGNRHLPDIRSICGTNLIPNHESWVFVFE